MSCSIRSQSNATSSRKTVASIIPWNKVCKMLDKVQSAVKAKKKEMLLLFINEYRKCLEKNSINATNNADSFFPVMRILLPGLDRDRGAYGVKEKKLADLYIQILALKKDGMDAQKLLNYRKPKVGGGGAGDFADVAFCVLRDRCPKDGTLTLEDVDHKLTVIAENYAAKNHDVVEKSVLYMLKKMTANEQKWLIRVLLKDMHLGLGQTSVFNAWHSDAKEFYDVNNSLFKVCITLRDPKVRLHEIEVSLFSPFRPMLAERAVLSKVETQMKNKTFFVETKYDGERSQIHKSHNRYKYFSRNGFDFSPNFGEDSSCGLFTPFIHSLFLPEVKEVILDGEMVGWSQKYETIISKAENLDVKNLKENGDYQVCFCIFDLLYLNGKVITNLPLSERLKKIPAIIKPEKGRILISSCSQVTSKEDVIQALNLAIDNREEGIILKDPDSVYQPASRKAGWIKVKPDYVDSLVPELDLLIIGGYYGTGKRRGILSHFLVACAVPNPKKDALPESFHSVCRVGSGYTVAELDDLIAKLSKHMTSKQPANVFVNKEKPPVWIHPEKSAVLQIRAAEITKSDTYKTAYTLRFPRVEKIRSDKAWHDILNVDEFHKLANDASGKLAIKHYHGSDDDSPSPRKKVARKCLQPSLPSYFRPADVSKVSKKTELFSNKEFCVMSNMDENGQTKYTKHDLEVFIAQHGGKFVQNPGANTFCILTDTETVRCRQFISKKTYNVVKPIWLLECIESCRLVSWSPIHVFCLRPENVLQMEQEFNKYGDSYLQLTNPKKLQYILDNITEDSYDKDLSIDQMCEFDELTVEPGDVRGLFRRVVAFFTKDGVNLYPEQSHSCILNFKLHGGTVSSSPNSITTHVIVPDSNFMEVRPSSFLGKHVVPFNWVTSSVQDKKLRCERMKF